jgi:hypothetical protein
VTVNGSAAAAGLSFGHYKDFLIELEPQAGRHRLELEVDASTDSWAFRVDGRVVERCWWDSAVRNVADILNGTLTLKGNEANGVLFQDLHFDTLRRTQKGEI